MTIGQSLVIDPDQQLKIEALAAEQMRSPEFLIREALEEYLQQHANPEKFLSDARNSLAHYERTGLHVTWEEADAWLARLENGERVPPPACHT